MKIFGSVFLILLFYQGLFASQESELEKHPAKDLDPRLTRAFIEDFVASHKIIAKILDQPRLSEEIPNRIDYYMPSQMGRTQFFDSIEAAPFAKVGNWLLFFSLKNPRSLVALALEKHYYKHGVETAVRLVINGEPPINGGVLEVKNWYVIGYDVVDQGEYYLGRNTKYLAGEGVNLSAPPDQVVLPVFEGCVSSRRF